MIQYWQQCIACNHRHQPVQFHYVCEKCNGLLLVERDREAIIYKLGFGDSIRRNMDAMRYGSDRKRYPNASGIWRWIDFIMPGFPIDEINDLPLSLREGNGDLFQVPSHLSKSIGLNRLLIKLEGQNPSGSFKDRGMPVAISEALRLQKYYPDLGIRKIACASTGDTSASAAIYVSYVNDKLKCIVLLPYGGTSSAQSAQVKNYGAKVIEVDHPDGFDACMKLVNQYCLAHTDVVLVNSKNSFRIAGQETIALNIIHDLDWKVPDWIAVPVGNGGNLTALMIGLLRAKEFGIIDRLPGIIAAQTGASNTLYRWQKSGFHDYQPNPWQPTIASAMNINDPVSFSRIKKLHKHFNLKFTESSEDDIKDTWMKFLHSGAPICPQSATALHGIIQARSDGVIKENQLVVSISTATDLKFSDPASHYHDNDEGKYSNKSTKVDGNLQAIEKALSE